MYGRCINISCILFLWSSTRFMIYNRFYFFLVVMFSHSYCAMESKENQLFFWCNCHALKYSSVWYQSKWILIAANACIGTAHAAMPIELAFCRTATSVVFWLYGHVVVLAQLYSCDAINKARACALVELRHVHVAALSVTASCVCCV